MKLRHWLMLLLVVIVGYLFIELFLWEPEHVRFYYGIRRGVL